MGGCAERDSSSVPHASSSLQGLVTRHDGRGARWQRLELRGNAAHGGRCSAQGAVPRWAPGAGRETHGHSYCSISCPRHQAGKT